MKISNLCTLLYLFIAIMSYASEDYPLVYFPPHCHRPASTSILGDSIALEDGSEWVVAVTDREKVLEWKDLDPLVIKLNDNWTFYYHYFVYNKEYKYLIFNKKTNESISANLHIPPIYGGENTYFISKIDYRNAEIVLQDRSRWKIKDRSIFERWSPNDLIIIGFKDGNFWSPDHYLLINARLDESCEASLIM